MQETFLRLFAEQGSTHLTPLLPGHEVEQLSKLLTYLTYVSLIIWALVAITGCFHLFARLVYKAKRIRHSRLQTVAVPMTEGADDEQEGSA